MAKQNDGKKRGSWEGKEPSKNYSTMMQAFRDNTRALRIKMGLTTRQFADKAEISQAWLYYLELTDKPVSFEQMVHIADTLGVPLDKLLIPGRFGDPSKRKAS